MSEQPKSNILKALEGEAITTNQPESRILQAIKNGGGGGGGGSYDDTALKQRISALENSQTQQDKLIAKNTGNIDRIAAFLGIDLTIEYLPLTKNQGVIIEDHIGIDTGLTLNGNAIFEFKGFLKDDQHQVCLMGARTGTSTTERTCINVLPQSGQVQSQWANNAYKVLKDDMNFMQPFEVSANNDSTYFIQNGVEIAAIQNGGFTGKNAATPICLFNQALGNEQYFSPVLQYARIDINGVSTIFEPKIKRNIETGIETVVMMKNGVDMNIDGLTLFEIQAA